MIKQFVSAEDTRIGQHVWFANQSVSRARWTVTAKDADQIVLRRGKRTMRVSPQWTLLQNVFENLRDT